MYLTPPTVITFTTVTTNAVANTLSSTILAAAPGVGFFIRLRYLSAAIRQNNTNPSAYEVSFFDTANFANMAFTMPGQVFVAIPFEFPGIQLASNTALTVSHACTVASQVMHFVAHYDIIKN